MRRSNSIIMKPEGMFRVDTDYPESQGLVLWATAAGEAGSTAIDRSVYRRSMPISSISRVNDPIQGTVYSINATAGYINAGVISELNGSFSVNCWAKWIALSYGLMFGKKNTTYSRCLAHGVFAANESVTEENVAVKKTWAYASDLIWHHYVWTYNSSSGRHVVYRDGAVVLDDVSAWSHTYTGDTYLGNNWGYQAWLDDCRVWNRELSAAEAKILAGPERWRSAWVPSRRLTVYIPAAGGTTINATCGQITIASLAASISQGTTIAVTKGAVTVASYAAQVLQGTTIISTCGAVTVAGLGATVVEGATVNASCGTVAVVGLAASISAGTTIDATCGGIVVAGLAATVDLGVVVNATFGEITIAGYAATVEAGTTIDVASTAGIVIASYPATVAQASTINATLGAVVVAALNASISVGTDVSATKGALVITGKNATITCGGVSAILLLTQQEMFLAS